MDYYLKANDEQALWETLVSVGAAVSYDVKDENGKVLETRHSPASGYSLDIVGTIYKPTGNVIQHTMESGETIEVPEMVALDGFHANLRGPTDLAPTFEYIPYVPTEEEQMDPEFVMPEPEIKTTPSVLESLLVSPATPSRIWA